MVVFTELEKAREEQVFKGSLDIQVELLSRPVDMQIQI